MKNQRISVNMSIKEYNFIRDLASKNELSLSDTILKLVAIAIDYISKEKGE